MPPRAYRTDPRKTPLFFLLSSFALGINFTREMEMGGKVGLPALWNMITHSGGAAWDIEAEGHAKRGKMNMSWLYWNPRGFFIFNRVGSFFSSGSVVFIDRTRMVFFFPFRLWNIVSLLCTPWIPEPGVLNWIYLSSIECSSKSSAVNLAFESVTSATNVCTVPHRIVRKLKKFT